MSLRFCPLAPANGALGALLVPYGPSSRHRSVAAAVAGQWRSARIACGRHRSVVAGVDCQRSPQVSAGGRNRPEI